MLSDACRRALLIACLACALVAPCVAQDRGDLLPDAEDAILRFSSPAQVPDEFGPAVATVTERARGALVEKVLSCTVREGTTLDDLSRTWSYTRREELQRWIQKRGRLVEIRLNPDTTAIEVDLALSVSDLQNQIGQGIAYSSPEVLASGTNGTPDLAIIAGAGGGIPSITLTATARGRIPAHLRGTDAGLAVAYDGAIQQARAMVKTRLMDLEYARGARVASYLVFRPTSEAHVRSTINQLEPIDEAFGEEYVQVTLSLPLRRLSRALPVGDMPGSAMDMPETASLSPDGTPKVRGGRMRAAAMGLWPGLVIAGRGEAMGSLDQAHAAALAAARSEIVASIHALSVPDGRTVRDLAAHDEVLARAIDGFVASAEVLSVTPNAEGGMVALIHFRPAVLQTIVSEAVERHKPGQTSASLVASISSGGDSPAPSPAADAEPVVRDDGATTATTAAPTTPPTDTP